MVGLTALSVEINTKLATFVPAVALIQDKVIFNDLGLIIVDEQHRFGVDQRKKLIEKGKNPHLLAMTATPIPRTLAFTLHGDMEISWINEMPLNRKKIITKVVNPNDINKIYSKMKKEMEKCIVLCANCHRVEEKRIRDEN